MVRPEDLGPENLAEQGGATSTATQSPSCLGLDVLWPRGPRQWGPWWSSRQPVCFSHKDLSHQFFGSEMSGFIFPEAKTLSP